MKFVTPSYQDCFYDVTLILYNKWKNTSWEDLNPAVRLVEIKNADYTYYQLFLVAFFAIFWTYLRSLTSKHLLKKIQSALSLNHAEDFPESLWKTATCSLSWFFAAYLVIHRYNLFNEPTNAIEGWSPDIYIPQDLSLLYLLQISLYFHGVYAVLYMDNWRKDSIALLVHHSITITLLVLSYLFRYAYIGVLIIFFHDLNDIILEVTKCLNHCKRKGGKWKAICEPLAALSFMSFGISWFVFRLYWFPLKGIYTSSVLSMKLFPGAYPPFFLLLNVLLILVFFLDIYWFIFIVMVIVRIATGQLTELEDTRNYKQQQNGVKKPEKLLKKTN